MLFFIFVFEMKGWRGMLKVTDENRQKCLNTFRAMLFTGSHLIHFQLQQQFKCDETEALRIWLQMCGEIQQLINDGTFSEAELQTELRLLYVYFGGAHFAPHLMKKRLIEIFPDKTAQKLIDELIAKIEADGTRENLDAAGAIRMDQLMKEKGSLINAAADIMMRQISTAARQISKERHQNEKVAPTKNVACKKCGWPLVVRPGQSKKVKCLKCQTRWKVDERTGAIVSQL